MINTISREDYLKTIKRINDSIAQYPDVEDYRIKIKIIILGKTGNIIISAIKCVKGAHDVSFNEAFADEGIETLLCNMIGTVTGFNTNIIDIIGLGEFFSDSDSINSNTFKYNRKHSVKHVETFEKDYSDDLVNMVENIDNSEMQEKFIGLSKELKLKRPDEIFTVCEELKRNPNAVNFLGNILN